MSLFCLGVSFRKHANMEAKLAEYRARKSRERRDADTTWQRVSGLFRTSQASSTTEEADRKQTADHTKQEETERKENDDCVDEEEEIEHSPPEKYTRLLVVLKSILWLLLWAIAIQVQFGAVYFAVSALAFIYINTRTGRSRSQKMSAYSVFNPNCERLTGTLTAEQIEQAMIHRRPLVES